jgi:triphosphoribosyl-dephospho-CoA synthase
MTQRVGDHISRCAGIAALLEVSAYPKPGNVHRISDFQDTRYEHFLASSVSIIPTLRDTSIKAHLIKKQNEDWGNLCIGEKIFEATQEMLKWQHGGNVQLGIILLYVPIAAAAGALYTNNGLNVDHIQPTLKEIIRAANPRDSINIYDAIRISMPKRVLGTVEKLDVLNNSSKEQILKTGLKPLEIFQECTSYDNICSEWTTGFNITINLGYPFLKKQLAQHDINTSTVNTFLYILSRHPDSLIQRKSGKKKAIEVSERAKSILKIGGASNEKGRNMLLNLDYELREAQGSLNPGTSADLTASSIFINTLSGWRP